MSGLTFEEARDTILSLLKTKWDLNTPAITGAVPEVEYQNVDPGKTPLSKGNKPWARAMVRHATGRQRSMGNAGNRLFQRNGVVTLQIFVPAGKQGLVVADRLGRIVVDAFEGEETSAGNVWFRNTTYREVGVDGAWFQVNVTSEFEYDTVK
jgi:hypothetical protein